MNKKNTLQAAALQKDFPLMDEALLTSRIHTIRGVKVMLDADLAEIYGYSTKRFNEQVKTNIERFEDDFRFQLTKSEYTTILSSGKSTLEQANLKSEKPTSSWGGVRKLPYAFTEQGIYMLMTVLKGERAIAQSKALIRLFKQMKDYIVAENQQLMGTAGIPEIALQTAQNTRTLAEHSVEIRELSGEVCDIRSDLGKMNIDLRKMMENFIDPSSFKHFLILNGRKLEADAAYAQIYGLAKKSVIVLDNYVDVKTLDLLRSVPEGVSVSIFSDQYGKTHLTDSMVADFKAARSDVTFDVKLAGNMFHDRYIYLDYGLESEKLFHCGASSKDAGGKVTTIMQIERPEVYHPLVESLKKMNL